MAQINTRRTAANPSSFKGQRSSCSSTRYEGRQTSPAGPAFVFRSFKNRGAPVRRSIAEDGGGACASRASGGFQPHRRCSRSGNGVPQKYSDVGEDSQPNTTRTLILKGSETLES